MGTTVVPGRTSRLRFGISRADITPPIGIYHRMWGAARHDRATGVHRPQIADVMVFGALDRSDVGLIRANLDLVTLAEAQTDDLRRSLSDASGVPIERIVVAYSHTHSGGWFVPDRVTLPGGELIVPYLRNLGARLAQASREAIASMQSATLTYAIGRCDVAANRDYWDDERGGHVCGYNPDAPADDTVVVVRATDASGRQIATVVNYACHPTTLAWDNTLLSPDFVGAMRETVERDTNAPCVFAQGACGDLGPRHGFVGDTAVADKNGRQLGYAALSAMASMGPPATDFQYTGAVISGATIGTWGYRDQDAERARQTSRFVGASHTVDLELKPRPERAALEAEFANWEARQREADARGDGIAARDFGARAERVRRWLGRIAGLPAGPTYSLPFSTYRLGDAVWVTTGGEPYNLIQLELRRRFPDRPIVFSPLSGGHSVAYLLPADRYGKGLYQEEPSILAPGCLEALIEAVAARIAML